MTSPTRSARRGFESHWGIIHHELIEAGSARVRAYSQLQGIDKAAKRFWSRDWHPAGNNTQSQWNRSVVSFSIRLYARLEVLYFAAPCSGRFTAQAGRMESPVPGADMERVST
jgi:hypothetical protein